MIVDGNAIAKKIYSELTAVIAALPVQPRMAIVTCAPNFETTKYLELKRKKASQVGIALTIIEIPASAQTEDFVASIDAVSKDVHGIVVQLPLPTHIDKNVVLSAIPADKDPDCLGDGVLLAPVVGAVDEISNCYNVVWENKVVAIVGYGRLVGQPVNEYAKKRGAKVTVLTDESTDFSSTLKEADIIVSGVGKPGLIEDTVVKPEVVLFDAGTSEDSGELRGGITTQAAEKAALYTPVPGGIGPITVAILLRNLVTLSQKHQ